ncbi:hypothetical protein E2C01_045704 [Portunus trituberculatus]|uniref:Uncharacterized protein n=1 Tax=Portunus trituberculatus TaxID=210409 RepID=A0A5B7FVU6_PORTR|nr:hypothetical protein [Portunus trituberculatus]
MPPPLSTPVASLPRPASQGHGALDGNTRGSTSFLSFFRGLRVFTGRPTDFTATRFKFDGLLRVAEYFSVVKVTAHRHFAEAPIGCFWLADGQTAGTLELNRRLDTSATQ